MTQPTNWKKEWRRRTDFDTHAQDHLFRSDFPAKKPEWYPESEYELDPEKVEEFIEETIAEKTAMIIGYANGLIEDDEKLKLFNKKVAEVLNDQ